MELKVIGSGSKGNAYLLENKEEALIIECGVNISLIKKSINFELKKIVGCILTHEHKDHCKAVNDVMDSGIDVYTSEKTHEAMKTNAKHRAKNIEPKESIKIGGFKIMAFDVKHDAVNPIGFLIEHNECGKVLFLTDTYYCKYRFKGLNNILIEANYSKEIIEEKLGFESGKEFLKNRILKSHFSIDNCKKMLLSNDLSDVNNIVLIHLSDSNSDEMRFKKEIFDSTMKNVSCASDGMIINFDKTPF